VQIAAKMTQEQRKARAEKAVAARWSKERAETTAPAMLYRGDLLVAGVTLPCAVVDMKNGGDPVRILTETGITNALLGVRSGASKRIKKKAEDEGPLYPFSLPQVS